MKVLHLVKNELKLLKKSVIIITLIFTVFLSALFGVISVQADLSQNIYADIDGSGIQLYLNVQSACLQDIRSEFEGLIVTAQKKGITQSAYLTNTNGDSFETSQTEVIDNTTIISNYNGAIISLNKATSDTLRNSSKLLQGEWPTAENEICICSYIAEYLNITTGDTLFIDDTAYTVSGIFNNNVLGYYYFVTVSNDIKLDKITAYFDSSENMYSAYAKLTNYGYTVEMPPTVNSYLENLSSVKGFLSSCAAILALVIIAVLYSLISIFYRQRKAYICQLKILGATKYTVAAVYCGIAVLMLFVSSSISTAFAIFFNNYILNLCSDLFGMAFSAHFNFAVPVLVFALLVLATFTFYLIFARKTKSAWVAQEIRNE